ncbi:AraC family transcriptional regulator [Nocardia pseudobrasiliensis]|uniref:AraC family transcriptional regulator n=1 Tax=Nocardia pseudobrasiliensis TaxID=45979 RepID=A0A370I0G6_9NOCA|nr:AraC family transcriptional regulator [Nocardia pseudobrasiliensis]RDI64243.1 AraC family transcriptional regulator [Nocardia pseudobrasiliensis]
MDPLESLLEGPRARGAFVMRSLLDPPWSLRVQDEAPLTVVAVVRGSGWIIPHPHSGAGRGDIEDLCRVGFPGTGTAAPRPLHEGDVAIFRGPDHYTVADDPSTEPQVFINPGQITTTPEGERLCETWSLGVRGWGPNPDAATMLVTGSYEQESAASRRLLRALPPIIVLRREELDSAVLELLVEESGRERPAQGAMLDRLLDLLLIAVLRAWFARGDAPAWYHAYSDPLVGKALRLLQNNPAHPWTVATLAAEVGASRAALARRFTDLVGEPPMGFLTDWRLALAADLLQDSDATVESIARRVGYGSAFALSTAFKRHYGISPREHRQTA